jgi:hypothetical protein
VQTGQNWPACFGLVAHLSGDSGGRSANDSAGSSPADSILPAVGSVEKWC